MTTRQLDGAVARWPSNCGSLALKSLKKIRKKTAKQRKTGYLTVTFAKGPSQVVKAEKISTIREHRGRRTASDRLVVWSC